MQQQPGQSGQQNMMMEPPKVLSTKDQLYLSDMLNWNLTATKKANFYAGQCNDNDIKSACQRVAQMHENHYQTLLSLLQQHTQ
ncbi:hypothetical protein HUG20_16565 [Salicibibacter cibi]|uniref:Spore coat protein n=2 Tax=Salicibibacter cibi TaxID=2743001 RepID=A0A7T6ZEX1_9BACI|nr:hypothetical protein [Salicibibacter cibi]QQK82032.1 hypothetical protein HUG20_16565 [Salicibibacter cibi]